MAITITTKLKLWMSWPIRLHLADLPADITKIGLPENGCGLGASFDISPFDQVMHYRPTLG